MAIKNSSGNSAVRRAVRMCCCPRQDTITPQDVHNLLMTPDHQLRNLPQVFADEIDGKTPYEIREMFSESNIPFRWTGCPRGDLLCCGCCTRTCDKRCPQDVLCRMYLICGHIIDAPEGERQKRYQESSVVARMLYDEYTSETPRYFAIVAMVNEYSSPLYNKRLEEVILREYSGMDSPCKYDYAPQFEYEEVSIQRSNGYEETRFRKKIDPATGDARVLYWPRSGMCPFCLPAGMVDRRRKVKGGV